MSNNDDGRGLSLTRNLGESIFIGDDIEVSITRIKGKQVRLRINASVTTNIHREHPIKFCTCSSNYPMINFPVIQFGNSSSLVGCPSCEKVFLILKDGTVKKVVEKLSFPIILEYWQIKINYLMPIDKESQREWRRELRHAIKETFRRHRHSPLPGMAKIWDIINPILADGS